MSKQKNTWAWSRCPRHPNGAPFKNNQYTPMVLNLTTCHMHMHMYIYIYVQASFTYFTTVKANKGGMVRKLIIVVGNWCQVKTNLEKEIAESLGRLFARIVHFFMVAGDARPEAQLKK